jgi:hypothetical protein
MTGSRGLNVHQIMEQLNGSPQYLGTIQSTGANVISNLSGAIRPGDRLLVQPDASGFILGADNATTPTTVNSATTGLRIDALEKFYITLSDINTPARGGLIADESWLQWISVSGTTNLKVWRLV